MTSTPPQPRLLSSTPPKAPALITISSSSHPSPDGFESSLPTPPTTPPPTSGLFSKPFPFTTSEHYLTTCTPGLQYALYFTAPMTSESRTHLSETLVFNATSEDWASAIVAAPTNDFTSPSKNTLRDVLDYHTSLLEIVRSNPWNLHHTRFLVAHDPDWARAGLLFIELDAHPQIRGVVGITRVAVDMAGSCLVFRERDAYSWEDFKLEEARAPFKDPIEGYTGTRWEKLGYEWYQDGALGDDELSEGDEDGSKGRLSDGGGESDVEFGTATIAGRLGVVDRSEEVDGRRG